MENLQTTFENMAVRMIILCTVFGISQAYDVRYHLDSLRQDDCSHLRVILQNVINWLVGFSFITEIQSGWDEYSDIFTKKWSRFSVSVGVELYIGFFWGGSWYWQSQIYHFRILLKYLAEQIVEIKFLWISLKYGPNG